MVRTIIRKRQPIIYLLGMLFVTFYLPSYQGLLNLDYLLIFCLTFVLSVVLFLFCESSGNWFDLNILFLLGFSIVHFQWPIMLSLSGIEPKRFSQFFNNSVYINYGTWLSLMAILSWMVGYSSLRVRSKVKNVFKIRLSKLLWLNIFLFGIFLSTAGAAYLSGSIYKGLGGTLAGEGVAAYIQIFLDVTIITLVILILYRNQEKIRSQGIFSLNKVFLILVLVYCTVFLAIGDRGAPMKLLFAGFAIYGTIVKRISFRKFLLISLVGAVVFTFIGLGRSENVNKNILSAGAEKYEFNSVYDGTIELANSARTLYSGLDHTPKYHDYFKGKLWLSNIFSPVPFLQNLYLTLTSDEAYEISSTGYITYLRYGKDPISGEGTSLVVDIYLNFGTTGVIIFMFLLGMFFKKTSEELKRQADYKWVVIGGVLASLAFYMGRASLFESFRPIIWSLIIASFVTKKVTKYRF